jgi:radical SAM protein with 4Fe4S-binding SPASM domain
MRLRVRRRGTVIPRLFPRRRSLRPPRPGLRNYEIAWDGGRAQLHLRTEANGAAVLLVNADRAVKLNATAALMAWLILEEVETGHALDWLQRRFRVDPEQLRDDFTQIESQIEGLLHPEEVCLIHDLDLEIVPPFDEPPSAPYRMDLAVTYRCNNDCPHCYNARSRSFPEIPTEAWQRIMARLWDIGVPHVCFTGGEATLRDDLPALIRTSKSLGQVTGLLTNGRRLSDPDYTDELVDAGLDHIQLTLESRSPDVHDRMVARHGAWNQTVAGIRNALRSGLFVMTNTTLLAENCDDIGATIDFLADLGVPTAGFNALIYSGHGASVGNGLPEASLGPLLEIARQRTLQHGMRLIWYTPTQYCHFDPAQMDLGVKGCTAAAYNMCVEPDGSVIPCQSYYQSMGNLLTDPWESIWNHELALWLRERRFTPDVCQACPVLSECGGGCPLALRQQVPADPLAHIIAHEVASPR